MQLLASKMTEIAPGTSSSTAGSSVTSEEQTVSAFDEKFKVSFEHAQTQSEGQLQTQPQTESLAQVSIDHSNNEPAGLTSVDSDNVEVQDNADWHELVSQSQAIDTDLTRTEAAPILHKEPIGENTNDSLNANELTDELNNVDEALLTILQAQQVESSARTKAEQLSGKLADEVAAELKSKEASTAHTTVTVAPNKLANEIKNALNIPPEKTLVDNSNVSLTDIAPSALADVTNASDEPQVQLTSTAVKEMKSAIDVVVTGKSQTPNTELTGPLQTPVKQQELGLNEQLDLQLTSDAEQALLQLSPKQLEQVAQHIFTRLEQGQKNLGDAKQFVNNLKSGLAEIKSQLQDGHVAGIDLSALVQDSLAKTEVMPVKLDQVVQQLSSTLGVFGLSAVQSQGQVVDTANVDLSTRMSAGVDAARHNLEVSAGQLEQTKIPQQTQNSFDKSVNLFKPEGQQQLADKVRWMNNNRQISAELRLDPEDLGAMQVKISMNGDSATVSMVVQTTQARDALEQATPRLREMLAEQGLSLGESSVNQDNSAGEQGAFEQGNTRQNERSATKVDESIQTGNIIAEQTIINGSVGGIDYYA